LDNEEHGADGGHGGRDSKAPDTELLVGVDRDDGEQHPDGHTHAELRDHGEHERAGQHSFGLHHPIQAHRIEVAPTGTVSNDPNVSE
jgi:hypothetical protein